MFAQGLTCCRGVTREFEFSADGADIGIRVDGSSAAWVHFKVEVGRTGVARLAVAPDLLAA